MSQKEDVNELITRIIKDGCQLIIHWITGKKDVQYQKRTNQPIIGWFILFNIQISFR